MDIKTFEHMQETVKKGKNIQYNIEACNVYIGALSDGIEKIHFTLNSYGHERNFAISDQNLLAAISESMAEILKNRIEQLEQEFVEL